MSISIPYTLGETAANGKVPTAAPVQRRLGAASMT